MDQVEGSPNLPVRAKINWFVCVVLLGAAFALCVWALSLNGTGDDKTSSFDGFMTLPALAFHVFVACGGTFLLVVTWLDPIPLEANYRVMGEPSYPEVTHSFCHIGRWTTFTLWCNTIGTIYFWAAAAVSGVTMHTGSEPQALLPYVQTLWEITFPMSFLVNLVVTFVLFPGLKKQGKFDKVFFMLNWRPQCMHNGFVLVSAMEAVLVMPPMVMGDFPIIVIYGLTYAFFSYILFAVTGIFHYFFLDPRFKFAPCGLVGLLLLLTALYAAGSTALTAAAHSWIFRVVILVAALATCTFRDAAAVAPSDASQNLC